MIRLFLLLSLASTGRADVASRMCDCGHWIEGTETCVHHLCTQHPGEYPQYCGAGAQAQSPGVRRGPTAEQLRAIEKDRERQRAGVDEQLESVRRRNAAAQSHVDSVQAAAESESARLRPETSADFDARRDAAIVDLRGPDADADEVQRTSPARAAKAGPLRRPPLRSGTHASFSSAATPNEYGFTGRGGPDPGLAWSNSETAFEKVLGESASYAIDSWSLGLRVFARWKEQNEREDAREARLDELPARARPIAERAESTKAGRDLYQQYAIGAFGRFREYAVGLTPADIESREGTEKDRIDGLIHDFAMDQAGGDPTKRFKKDLNRLLWQQYKLLTTPYQAQGSRVAQESTVCHSNMNKNSCEHLTTQLPDLPNARHKAWTTNPGEGDH